MEILKSMFPHLQEEVIGDIFSQCQGDLDTSVTICLSLSEQARATQESQNNTPHFSAIPQSSSSHFSPVKPQTTDAVPSISISKDRKQLVLKSTIPDDFLRPPSYFSKSKNPFSQNSEVSQDFELALQLQQQMFQAEKRVKKRPKKSSQVSSKKSSPKEKGPGKLSKMKKMFSGFRNPFKKNEESDQSSPDPVYAFGSTSTAKSSEEPEELSQELASET